MKIDMQFSENRILHYLIFTCQFYQYIIVTFIAYNGCVCQQIEISID